MFTTAGGYGSTGEGHAQLKDSLRDIRQEQRLPGKIAAYSPDEARDNHGKWTQGGDGADYKPAGLFKDGVPKIPLSEFPLTPAQKAMEMRFRTQVAANPDRFNAEYRARFTKHGTLELNADNAKELSTDYMQNRTDGAAAAHETASWLMKWMYAQELAKPAPAGKENTVLFTAGGAGAGKTSALNARFGDTPSSAQVVYDGTLRPAASAISKIEQALTAGKHADIMFTYRDPESAFRSGVLDRAAKQEKQFGSGRTVMLDEFVNQHSSVQDSMAAIHSKFRDDPRVTFGAYHNGEDRTVRSTDLTALPKAPHVEALRARLSYILKNARETGAISPRIYEATKSAGATHEVGM